MDNTTFPKKCNRFIQDFIQEKSPPESPTITVMYKIMHIEFYIERKNLIKQGYPLFFLPIINYYVGIARHAHPLKCFIMPQNKKRYIFSWRC